MDSQPPCKPSPGLIGQAVEINRACQQVVSEQLNKPRNPFLDFMPFPQTESHLLKGSL